MYSINKYIFEEVCDNNMEIYNDIMETIRCDYNEIVGKLADEKSIPEIRQLVHKLVGVILILEGKNYEIMYYLKLLLNIDKQSTNLKYYQTYIKMITDYDKSFFGVIGFRWCNRNYIYHLFYYIKFLTVHVNHILRVKPFLYLIFFHWFFYQKLNDFYLSYLLKKHILEVLIPVLWINIII